MKTFIESTFITIFSFIITALIFNNFDSFSFNIGSLWISFKFYISILIGLKFCIINLLIIKLFNKETIVFNIVLFSILLLYLIENSFYLRISSFLIYFLTLITSLFLYIKYKPL